MAKWIVTTSGDRGPEEVAKDLAQIGFSVEQLHKEIGSLAGDASDDVAERARQVPGVMDVSPDTSIDLGPPDAPVTW